MERRERQAARLDRRHGGRDLLEMAGLQMDDPRGVVGEIPAVPGRRVAHDVGENFGHGAIVLSVREGLAAGYFFGRDREAAKCCNSDANRVPPNSAGGMGLRTPIHTGYQPETTPIEGTAMDIVQSRPTTSCCEAAASSILPRASTVSSMSPCATAASPRWARTCRRPAKETIDVRGKLVLPGLIDTHAHVYRYVSGRFGLDADTVGVHSGVTTVVDQGGPSVLTFPGFREYVAKPASTRVLAFISAYMVGGLEGHYYPELYRPDCIAVDDTVRAGARERRPGARREGPCRDRRLHALGRRGDAPRRRDRPGARPAALHPLRPALAACPRTSIPTIPTPSCRTC